MLLIENGSIYFQTFRDFFFFKQLRKISYIKKNFDIFQIIPSMSKISLASYFYNDKK